MSRLRGAIPLFSRPKGVCYAYNQVGVFNSLAAQAESNPCAVFISALRISASCVRCLSPHGIGDEAQQAKAKEKFPKLRDSLTKFYTDEDYFYAPKRPLIGLKFSIDHLQKITCTTAGSKLKKLAKV